MFNEAVARSIKIAAHHHQHVQNRFGVIPVPLRLKADAALTGRGVTMAVLDSGFYPHPDLTEPGNRIIAYHDVTGAQPTIKANQAPQGYHWHGTQTAVVAAGNGHLSDRLYRGLASDANLVLVKASDAEGRITEEAIARGIEWTIENRVRYGIRILSISLGGDHDIPYTQSIINRAAERAVRAGIVLVVAAGNNGFGENAHSIPPANSPSVITVGGYDDRNQFDERLFDLYHSNYGATSDGTVKPELIAPAMWVATPILPGTPAYKAAEALSNLNVAPDYMLRSLLEKLCREAELPLSLGSESGAVIRKAVESQLRERKIVATHYQHGDGTSFAAPIVASLIAQMLEANPRLTPDAVKQILISTADRLRHAPAIRQGYGIVNAQRAVAEASREQHALDMNQFSAPRVLKDRLAFFYHNDAAQRVALAGDFNNWDTQAALFTKEADGIWRALIECLPAGRYRYKFLVNNERWLEDPGNALREPDEFGGFNSLLFIS
jgi:serine protease AprX